MNNRIVIAIGSFHSEAMIRLYASIDMTGLSCVFGVKRCTPSLSVHGTQCQRVLQSF